MRFSWYDRRRRFGIHASAFGHVLIIERWGQAPGSRWHRLKTFKRLGVHTDHPQYGSWKIGPYFVAFRDDLEERSERVRNARQPPSSR